MPRKKQTGSQSAPLTEAQCQEVAQVAYGLWEQRGRTHGSHEVDWFEAERIVRERAGTKRPAARKARKSGWTNRLKSVVR